MIEIVKIMILGSFAGFCSGCLGIGGGVIIVPGLVFLIGLSYHKAMATSLVAMVPIVIVGMLTNLSVNRGQMNIKEGITLAAAGIIFSFLGVLFRSKIASERFLEILFAIVLIALAFKMILFPATSYPSST